MRWIVHGKARPFALYIWSVFLCITSVPAAVCLTMGAPLPLLAGATFLCLAVALFGAILVGLSLPTLKEVARAAAIGAAVLSLSGILIPVAVMDASNPACTTRECDLGPSAGGAAFFVVSSLLFFVLIGSGYRLRTRQLSRLSDQ